MLKVRGGLPPVPAYREDGVNWSSRSRISESISEGRCSTDSFSLSRLREEGGRDGGWEGAEEKEGKKKGKKACEYWVRCLYVRSDWGWVVNPSTVSNSVYLGGGWLRGGVNPSTVYIRGWVVNPSTASNWCHHGGG